LPRSTTEILRHADELADAFENLDPGAGSSRITGLGDLFLAVQDRAASERRLRKAVSAAREDGTSWGFIGRMLGTSGEAARQRFGSAGSAKRAKKAAKATSPSTTAATAKSAAKSTAKAAAATKKATPKKAAPRKSDYGLAAHGGRKQSTGKTSTRVTGITGVGR